MRKKKVIVSACLLGEMCRYDGTTKGIDAIKAKFGNDVQIIPFCPEDPVLGTPRERISVIFSEDKYRVITDESGIEITSAITLQTQNIIKQHPDVDMVILKSKSPSCGLGTTPILSKNKKLMRYENGIAAQYFMDTLTEIDIMDEHQFLDEYEN